jgi:hypothetical protein
MAVSFSIVLILVIAYNGSFVYAQKVQHLKVGESVLVNCQTDTRPIPPPDMYTIISKEKKRTIGCMTEHASINMKEGKNLLALCDNKNMHTYVATKYLPVGQNVEVTCSSK